MDMSGGDEDEQMEEEDGGDEYEDDGYGEDEDDGGAYGGDDDDSSWKVRRASIRVLSALVTSRLAPPPPAAAAAGDAVTSSSSSPLGFVFTKIVPALVSRLKNEREETVRLDIIAALSEAVRIGGATAAAEGGAAASGATKLLELEMPLQSLGAATLPIAHASGAGSSTRAAAVASAAAASSSSSSSNSSVGDEITMSDAVSAVHISHPHTSHAVPSSHSGTTSTSNAAAGLLAGATAGLIVPCLRHLGVTVSGKPAPITPHGLPFGKSAKTKTAVLGLLQRLILSLASSGDVASVGALKPYLPGLFSVLISTASSGADGAVGAAGSGAAAAAHPGQLRLDALATLHILLLALSPYLSGAVPAGALTAEAVTPHLTSPALSRALTSAAVDDWYRLSAQALRTIALTVTLLRPADRSSSSSATTPALLQPSVPSFPSVVGPLATAVLSRLTSGAQQAVDQEVQEGAITAAGVLLAHAGDVAPLTSSDTLTSAASALAGRMRSEHTRAVALRSVTYAASSPLHLPLAPPLAPAVASDFPGYLRQASKSTRLQALATLAALVTSSSSSSGAADSALDLTSLAASITETAANISDGDLILTSAALELVLAVMKAYPAAAAAGALAGSVLPRILRLASSPVLQGGAAMLLQSVLSKAASMGDAASGPFALQSLVDGVLAGAKIALGGQSSSSSSAAAAAVPGAAGAVGALSIAAKSLGSLLSAAPVEASKPILTSLLQTAILPAGAPVHAGPLASFTAAPGSFADVIAPARILALRTLGEAGRYADVTSPSLLGPSLPSHLVSSFAAPSEDVRNAGAWALGCLAAGPGHGPAAALTVIQEGLSSAASTASAAAASSSSAADATAKAGSATESCYLYVSAIRSAVISASGVTSSLAAHVPVLLTILSQPGVAASSDVGVRTAVAEALGRLCCIDAERGVSAVMSLALTPGAPAGGRWTAVTSLRHSSGSHEVASVLARAPPAGVSPDYVNTAGALLATCVDADLSVRQAALTSVAALAHTSPTLLAPLLKRVPVGRFPGPVPPPLANPTVAGTC